MNGWIHRSTSPAVDGIYQLLTVGVNDTLVQCEKDVERIEWRESQWWSPTGEPWGVDGLTPDMWWRCDAE